MGFGRWLRMAALCSMVVLSLGMGCGDGDGNETDAEEGEGTLALTLWGEEFIEEGIPSDAFEDGFEVVFDTFLINVGEIEVAGGDGTVGLAIQGMGVWDLTETGPFELSSKAVSAGAYSHTAYTIAPATAESEAGNVDGTDLTKMIDNNYSIYVEGIASDGTREVAFSWGFDTETVYDPCHSKGVLAADGAVSVQLTIHGDHLFYDSAVSDSPKLRFETIADADADSDGIVTSSELEATAILPLDFYGVGSLDIENLWEYLSHMTTTVGHIDGEGHCDV